MSLGIYTGPMCPIRWCQTMAALFHYWSSRLPPDLQPLTSSGSMQKEPKFYCLSISPVNEPTARFHNGVPIETLVSFQSLFYISLGFLNKQGLNETKPHLYLPVKGKERPIPVPPKGLLWRQLLRFHSQYIIIGPGEIRECSKDMLIGQLFIETALVTVKQLTSCATVSLTVHKAVWQ